MSLSFPPLRSPLLWALLVLGLLLPRNARASAPLPVDTTIVEVTGVVFTGRGASQVPVPFATVTHKKGGRGTLANFSGIFSIVVKKGETLQISALGFRTEELQVPKNYPHPRMSVSIELEETEYELPSAVVFPWPDRDNLRLEFLDMDPGEALALEDVASKNLAERELRRIGKSMKPDGNENADYYLRMQARNLYTFGGQLPPMPIMSPLAWGQFIKSLKDKKKRKDDDD
jgi:hypothetical protein